MKNENKRYTMEQPREGGFATWFVRNPAGEIIVSGLTRSAARARVESLNGTPDADLADLPDPAIGPIVEGREVNAFVVEWLDGDVTIESDCDGVWTLKAFGEVLGTFESRKNAEAQAQAIVDGGGK